MRAPQSLLGIVRPVRKYQGEAQALSVGSVSIPFPHCHLSALGPAVSALSSRVQRLCNWAVECVLEQSISVSPLY